MAGKHSHPAEQIASNASTPILSAGQVFADGGVIELVRRNNELELLAWDGATAAIGRTVQYGADVYAPATFDQTIVSRVTFPGEPKSYRTSGKLVQGVSVELKRFLIILE